MSLVASGGQSGTAGIGLSLDSELGHVASQPGGGIIEPVTPIIMVLEIVWAIRAAKTAASSA